jgi:hypothetical protein
MTRNSYSYMIAGLAAAGALWAARRWGVAERALSALRSRSARPGAGSLAATGSTLRGDTNYRGPSIDYATPTTVGPAAQSF